MTERRPQRPETLLARALGWVDEATDALAPPIQPSTVFLRDPDALSRAGRKFTRDDNTTYHCPEALIAALEGGTSCLLFASGMAAASAVFSQLARGDGVLLPDGVYWGARRWLMKHGLRLGLDVRFADMTQLHEVEAILARGDTRLVWIESPSNPTLAVTDIAALARLARRHGALSVADNTIATPLATQPLTLGVDIVLHSASKYLNGHADVVAGALVLGADCQSLQGALAEVRNDYGAVLGTFEAWMLLRGLRTLHLRHERICANALTIAQALAQDPRVAIVHYPGLAGHPGHALARNQMKGRFGGLISFCPAGGAEAAARVAAGVHVIRRAISFGGLESSIEQRRGMEGHESLTPPDLLRLSVGIEHVEDLIDDLKQALVFADDAHVAG